MLSFGAVKIVLSRHSLSDEQTYSCLLLRPGARHWNKSTRIRFGITCCHFTKYKRYLLNSFSYTFTSVLCDQLEDGMFFRFTGNRAFHFKVFYLMNDLTDMGLVCFIAGRLNDIPFNAAFFQHERTVGVLISILSTNIESILVKKPVLAELALCSRVFGEQQMR